MYEDKIILGLINYETFCSNWFSVINVLVILVTVANLRLWWRSMKPTESRKVLMMSRISVIVKEES